VYFNAVLLMRAVSRAAPYLEAYDIGTAPNTRLVDEKVLKKRSEDKAARNTLKEVLALAEKGESGFDEKDFFAGEDSLVSALSLNYRAKGLQLSVVERAIQDPLPECLADHGLRRL
jgi:hypothetical protein